MQNLPRHLDEGLAADYQKDETRKHFQHAVVTSSEPAEVMLEDPPRLLQRGGI